ncbi:MAG: outer membrane lipoprotein-sorting protein [Bacteroidetes bacterium]|nr:outer membrane lipoprotein-sorting protein [Bacteroidota bacterium]
MKNKLLLVLIAFVGSHVAQAQTVDEIISKYFENTGGIDKWKSLQNMKMTATGKQGALEFPMTIVQLKDGRQMSAVTFQGKVIKQGVYDGSTLWSHNFTNMKAEKSDAEATENYKQDIGEFPDPFLNYKERGLKAELIGKEKIDGTETFKIKLTKKPIKVDGTPTDNVVFYYFDAENFVPIMTESEIKSGPAKGQISQNKMSDYQEASGLMFPFSFAQGLKGQPSGFSMTASKVEVNVKVDDKDFAFPTEN